MSDKSEEIQKFVIGRNTFVVDSRHTICIVEHLAISLVCCCLLKRNATKKIGWTVDTQMDVCIGEYPASRKIGKQPLADELRH